MAYIKGYSIVCDLGTSASTLPVKGLETAGIGNAPEFEEILVKASSGKAEKELVGGKVSISLGGKINLKSTEEASSHFDYTDIEGWSRAGTTIYFDYGTDADGVSGSGKITSYSESTDSKATGTWSATLEADFDDISVK